MSETSRDRTAAAWRDVLALALHRLGYSDKPTDQTRLRYIVEREETIAALRSICATYGDNDWSAHLHLADILDKHLLPYLAKDKGRQEAP